MPDIIIVQNSYPDEQALLNVLNYVLRSEVNGGYSMDPAHAFRLMQLTKKLYFKQDGPQLLHFILSFSHREAFRVDTDDLLRLGFETGQLFCEFQMVYAVHFDGSHLHLHVVMNTVSFRDGHRYSDGRLPFWKLRDMLRSKFPKSDVGIYVSDSNSAVNRYSYSVEDDLLRIDS